MFDVFLGICIVRRWVAGSLYKNMEGCDNMVRYAQFTDDEIPKGITLFFPLEVREVTNL